MSWEYRVVTRTNEDGEVSARFCEVYLDADGKPDSYSETHPIESEPYPIDDPKLAMHLRRDLLLITSRLDNAKSKPWLDESEF